MTCRGWIAAGCLLLTVAACSRPITSPLPEVTPSVASASPTTPSPSPSATATPTLSRDPVADPHPVRDDDRAARGSAVHPGRGGRIRRRPDHRDRRQRRGQGQEDSEGCGGDQRPGRHRLGPDRERHQAHLRRRSRTDHRDLRQRHLRRADPRQDRRTPARLRRQDQAERREHRDSRLRGPLHPTETRHLHRRPQRRRARPGELHRQGPPPLGRSGCRFCTVRVKPSPTAANLMR